MEKVFYTFAALPWCELLIASGERGLLAARFVREEGHEQALARLAAVHRHAQLVESENENRHTVEELNAYAAGKLREFSVPLDLCGTDFQLAAWRALLEIPYGKTRSYGDIARRIGHPKSFRAVGMANHSNPIAIIVPCHRVIGSNRSLVGYGGGLDLKRALLDFEHNHSSTGDAARDSCSLPLRK